MAHVGLLEDNTRIARLCSTMLQYAGHQVVVYGHPRECLEALLPQPIAHGNKSPLILTGTLPIDLLILDLHLPDIPGLDVLRSLCAHPETRVLPLVFCTAATPQELSRALRIAPHASFIEKPFTYQQLISAITAVLKLYGK